MRIYSVGPRDDVQRLDIDIELRVDMLKRLGLGVPWEGAWTPPRAWRLQKPRKRTPEPLCDWTTVGAAEGCPALSSRAKDVVEPLIGPAQWLPLEFEECEYWLLNLLHLPEVLDVDASKVSRLPDGKVREIEEFAFRPPAVADEWLFKLSASPGSVFATDRFRDCVEREGLTGLFFQPVWDSEHAPFKPIPDRGDIIKRPEIYGPKGFVPNVKELWPPEWKKHTQRIKP
jgi:hypothetical protein